MTISRLLILQALLVMRAGNNFPDPAAHENPAMPGENGITGNTGRLGGKAGGGDAEGARSAGERYGICPEGI